MKGAYDVKVGNRRLQYKFRINRNITILRGDSATGKTTLIDMVAAHQRNGDQSGVSISCKVPCVVLSATNWEANLKLYSDSIVFIDEGEPFVKSQAFASAVKDSNNYYVIASRASLFNLPHSVSEIYNIKNTGGNKYKGTKRTYSRFDRIYPGNYIDGNKPELVIVEDSNSGFEFFTAICKQAGTPCVSAKGNSNIYSLIKDTPENNILVIADGAAFGPEMERILALTKTKHVSIYLPESFEWLILESGIITSHQVPEILQAPCDYIESEKFFTWERFFTHLLTESTAGTYLAYQKHGLNPVYLQDKEKKLILDAMTKE